MTRQKGFEMRIAISEDDLDKLQGGKILKIGLLNFGIPVKVSMQKRKTPEKVVQAAS